MSGLNKVALFLAMGLALAGGSCPRWSYAAEVPPPTLRAWQNENLGRFVIEWSVTTRVQQKRVGRQLVLRFARPFTADPGAAVSRLDNFLDADKTIVDGADLSLALKPGVSAKLQISDKRIIAIDLQREPQKQPRAEVDVSKIENGVRLSFRWPVPTRLDVRQQDSLLALTITPGIGLDPTALTRLNQTLQPWFSAIRQSAGPNRTSLSFDLNPSIRSTVRSEDSYRSTVDLTRDASQLLSSKRGDTDDVFLPVGRPKRHQSSESEVGAAVPPIPQPRPADLTRLALADETSTTDQDVPDIIEKETDSLQFNWGRAVGAAIFKRAGYLWAVFSAAPADSRLPLPPPAPPPFGSGELIEVEQGTAIRFPLNQQIGIKVDAGLDGRWQIKSDTDPPVPTAPIIERIGQPSVLHVEAPSDGMIVRLVDPAVGDEINVWPLHDPGVGQPVRRRFVDLDLLPTVQGLVWRSLDDRLIAAAIDNGLQFRSEHGLSLSTWSDAEAGPGLVVRPAFEQEVRLASVPDSQDESSIVQAGVELPEISNDLPPKPRQRPTIDHQTTVSDHGADRAKRSSYFDFAGSGVDRAIVTETRRVLRQAISRTSPDERDRARLSLAKLLVAERLAIEARTILDSISDNADDDVATSRRALRGATAFLIGHISEASSLLLSSEFDGDEEIEIWRAALNSVSKNWPTAAEGWKAVDKLLDRYPPRLKLDLGLMAIEAAIETNDDAMIRKGFQRLKSLELQPYDAARIQFMKALEAERAGNLERARSILKTLAEGRLRDISTSADFQLAALSLGDDAADPERMAVLESRLPLWRGHPVEMDMIDKLARRYRDMNRLRKALNLWQHLIDLYPKAGQDPTIREARQSTFVQALSNKTAPELSLLDVYSVYLDFTELLPDDPEARQVHRDLARHLAELDLLEEAVQVLRLLAERATDNVERADIGVQMATLLLNQGHAAQALAILDQTETHNSPLPSSLDDARRLTRARALSSLGREEDALIRLRNLQDASARRLSAEILWKQEHWPRLAAVIESLLADPALPSPLTAEDQKLVLWLAMAREREGQPNQLRDLRRRYAAEMQIGPWASAFQVVTQTTDNVDDVPSVLAATENHLAELRRFREETTTNP